MKYLLALDQGTTSSRALVINESGKVVAVAQKEFTQIFPQPGWVEHDPNEIWSSQIGVAAEALGRAGISAKRRGRRSALPINVRPTVVWDRKTSEPIHNAIVWQDRRTAGICDKMKADGLEVHVHRKVRSRHRCLLFGNQSSMAARQCSRCQGEERIGASSRSAPLTAG